jgi:hypothetical protein
MSNLTFQLRDTPPHAASGEADIREEVGSARCDLQVYRHADETTTELVTPWGVQLNGGIIKGGTMLF